MYIIIILLLIGAALLLVVNGFQKHRHYRVFLGVMIALSTGLLFWFLDFWGELLWFQSLGYHDRFIIVFFSKTGLALGGVILGWVVVYLLTFRIPKNKKFIGNIKKILT